MKVCMIVEDYPPEAGGGGISVYEMSKRLAKNHEVTVLTICRNRAGRTDGRTYARTDERTNGHTDEHNEEGVHIVRTGTNKATFFFLAISYLMRKDSFDIYHAHGTFCGLIAKMASVLKNKPVILHLHGYRDRDVGAIKHHVQNFIIRLGFSAIISVDKYGTEKAMELGTTRERVYHINSGVDLEQFQTRERNKTGKTIFLFVGRLTAIKNVELLLRAMAESKGKDTGLDSRAELWIVGDGELKDRLTELAKSLQLKNVKFLGRVPYDELPGLYAQATFLVLPSKTEGQPLVVLEALASRLPIILSDIPPLKEIVDASGAGYCFRTNDQNALKDVLKKATQIGESEYKKLIKKATEYAAKHSWQEVADEINGVYKNIKH